MSHVAPGSSSRDARIDWLRGLAALLVLGHHLFAPLDLAAHPALAPAAGVAHFFWLGVPVFFVLSGRCVGAAWLRDGSASSFAVRRLRRIYPPYLASLFVCLAVIGVRLLVAGVNDVAALPSSPGAILATLFLATAPATTLTTLNWVYWSLTYELAFYLLLAALLFLPGRLRLSGWLVLHAILCSLDLAALARPATPFFLVDQWPLFALGVALAFLRPARSWALATLAFGAAHLLALAWQDRLGQTHAVGLATALLLVLPSALWSPTPRHPLARVGAFSYSLYLVHVPVGAYLILGPVANLLGRGDAARIVAMLAAATVSLIAAWAFHCVFERPWMNAPNSHAPAP